MEKDTITVESGFIFYEELRIDISDEFPKPRITYVRRRHKK